MGRSSSAAQRKSAWRLFERFVADLEIQLQNTNAVIKCPDKILDVDGIEREVDCSVRALEDGEEVLVIFECRDRKSGNDIIWIDGIESKGRDIGAKKVVAVHRQPLSNAARTKAKRVGIDVRQLRKLTSRSNPFGIVGFGFGQSSLQLGPTKIKFSSDPDLQAKFAQILADSESEFGNPILLDSLRGKPCTVRDFVLESLKENNLSIPAGLEERQTMYLSINPSDTRTFSLELSTASLPIEWAEFEVTIVRAMEMLHLNQSAHYIAPAANVDHDVDQYVFQTQDLLITGAGITTQEVQADGSIQVQHTVSLSQGIGFNQRLNESLNRLLAG